MIINHSTDVQQTDRAAVIRKLLDCLAELDTMREFAAGAQLSMALHMLGIDVPAPREQSQRPIEAATLV